MTHSGSVLLLGEDTRMVLASARSLGRAGLAVHVAWCPDASPALRSRFVTAVHRIAAPGEAEGWEGELETLLRERDYDLVLPVTDVATSALQADHARWRSFAELELVEADAYRVLSDKRATSELARRLGVPVLEERHLADPGDLARCTAELGFPLAVKPARSTERGRAKHYVRIAPDLATAKGLTDELFEAGAEVLVQEYAGGYGVGVEFLARDGEIAVAFQHRRLHETNGHGSTLRESVELDPTLLDWTARLVREVGLTGLAMAEFRVDPDAGRSVLLEVNCRPWGSFPLAVAAGVPFAHLLYRQRVLGERLTDPGYRAGVRCRNLFGDARFLARSLARESSTVASHDDQTRGWQVRRVPKAVLLGDSLRGLLLIDKLDTFALDDPRPLATDVLQLIRFFVRVPTRRVARRLGLARAETAR